MNKYTFNYSVSGVLSFAPMFVTVEADNLDAAKTLAIAEINKKWPDYEVFLH